MAFNQTCEKVEEGAANAVQIRSMGCSSLELLRGHVAVGADDGTGKGHAALRGCGRLDSPKVHQVNLAARLAVLQQNVLRLDVSAGNRIRAGQTGKHITFVRIGTEPSVEQGRSSDCGLEGSCADFIHPGYCS